MKALHAKLNESKGRPKACACSGACTGYSTRSNCPPLIVLAIAAISSGTRTTMAPSHAS